MTPKKRLFSRLFRIVFILIMIAVIVYALIILHVFINERGVSSTVPSEDQYDAIIVLGAQVLPDGTPSVQLGWRLDAAYEA